jgi:hypothetical protein
MVRGLPDFTRKMQVIAPELEPAGVYIARDAMTKTANPLTTEYLKEQCILPNYATLASPIGMMTSYEGGWICRALIYKNGTGERDLAKNILDHWVQQQLDDGSWHQQYEPYLNVKGTHDKYEDLQVDSGAALLCWAMAEYDATIGPASVIYKETVRKAFNFLRDCQVAHFNAHGSYLLANQRFQGTWNTTALAADCGEVLLATAKVLDQYGDTLTNQAGYSIKTFGNDLYEAIATKLYMQDNERYYRTEYPAGGIVRGLEMVLQQLSFAQALCGWAVKNWAGKAYRTGSDYSDQAEKVLDKSLALTMGKWGGIMYRPYFDSAIDKRDEYTNYAAIMCLALQGVNATKYADRIKRLKYFIQLAALSHGEVNDYINPSGKMDVAANAHYGFLSLNAATGLLTGA